MPTPPDPRAARTDPMADGRDAEQRLRRSEERLRLALSAARMNIWDWDLDTDLVACSDNAREFWGIDVGRSADFTAAVHPDDVAALDAAARTALAEGSDYDLEYRLIPPGGAGVRWVHSRGRVERDATGRARRILGVTIDITERRQAEQGSRLLAAAGETLGASLDYHATLRELGRVVVPQLADWYAVDLLTDSRTLQRVSVQHADPARSALAEELLTRYPARPDAPLGAWQVVASGQPQWHEQIDDDLLASAAQDAEHLRVLRGLGLRSFIRVPMISHGTTIGVLTLVMAESGRRYRQADVDLARDVARRAATAVDNARLFERLQREDRRKDEFLAMLAHELRNPLAPLRHGLAVLQSEPPPAHAARVRQIMQRQLGHMVRLVDDLLDLSRITRGTIELKPAPEAMSAVIASAVETSRPLIDAAGVELTLQLPATPLWLQADHTRLSQVLTNLLGNAARFTPPGGRITLAAWEDGDDAIVEVIDTGIGIPPAMLSQVFDLFVRAEHAERHAPGGLGIGLTLARRLVELHGGEISAASDGPGRGSRFTVRLPRLATTPAGAAAAADDRAALADDPCRVMVVDDNADAAETLRMLLALAGHDVRVATSGAEALPLAVHFHPELALLDIGMPGMSGHELAAKLRGMPGLAGTTLVALTGWGREEDRQRSREAGFDHHLTKPVDIDEVLALVARCGGRG